MVWENQTKVPKGFEKVQGLGFQGHGDVAIPYAQPGDHALSTRGMKARDTRAACDLELRICIDNSSGNLDSYETKPLTLKKVAHVSIEARGTHTHTDTRLQSYSPSCLLPCMQLNPFPRHNTLNLNILILNPAASTFRTSSNPENYSLKLQPRPINPNASNLKAQNPVP